MIPSAAFAEEPVVDQEALDIQMQGGSSADNESADNQSSNTTSADVVNLQDVSDSKQSQDSKEESKTQNSSNPTLRAASIQKQDTG